MVNYQILDNSADIRPLDTQQGKWRGMFEDLAQGKDIKLSGTLEELRTARRSILSSYNFRKRRYPESHFAITTNLMLVDGAVSLVIKRVKGTTDDNEDTSDAN